MFQYNECKMPVNESKTIPHFLFLRKKNQQLFGSIALVTIMHFHQVMLSVRALSNYPTAAYSLSRGRSLVPKAVDELSNKPNLHI